jgi:4-carboxymuconolactone decarboxylase
MAKIPLIEHKESLAPEHQGIYDAIVKTRGEVRGCFPALLHSPVIADHTASLGAYLRFNSQLDPKVRALAAMTTSRELDCVHEWAAGVKNAEKNGISNETVQAIHQRKPTTGLPLDEAQVVNYVRELVHSHRVTEPTFEALRVRLDVNGIVELTATIGYYSMISCTLNAFELSSSPNPKDFPI